MIFSSQPPKKRKGIKLFTRESSQQAKEEREIFLGFLLITTTAGMESKLNYNYFFLKVFSNTQEESEKKKQTYMDITMKKYEHQHLEWVCEHECNVGEKYVLSQA